MAGKPANKPALARFGALLAGHLANGMRPNTATGEPWTDAEFAQEVTSSRTGQNNVSARTVGNWRTGKVRPTEITPILRALFGPSERHAQARDALRAAFIEARDEVITAARPAPEGPAFTIEAPEIKIDRTVRRSDERAANDPFQQQLQGALRDAALTLAEAARRLANTRNWPRLAPAAAAFHALLAGEDLRVFLGHLGTAYALMLELGGFLESDQGIRQNPGTLDDPLDPDIHRALTHLVRTAAPWLRGFPTIATYDDRAAKALLRMALLAPARGLTSQARDSRVISAADADELERLGRTGGDSGFLGQKAANRAIGAANNLSLALLQAKARAIQAGTGGDAEAWAQLMARVETTLVGAKADIEHLAAGWPDDLRLAAQSLLSISPEPETGQSASGDEIPDDVEELAAAMILEGKAPPINWHPHIQRLDFTGESLTNVAPLAGLTALQSLDLTDTFVSDITPLAGLIALRNLHLTNSRVGDIAPLSGLTALQTLDIWSSQLSDITPLTKLTSLEKLSLICENLSDISSLAHLTELQTLHLSGTQIANIRPLAELTAIHTLDLWNTLVSDLAPLVQLTTLKTLNLVNTRVRDVAPLAGMTELKTLTLMGTEVSDVSPLAGLTALQALDLTATKVRDIGPLSALTALRSLILMGTRVSDISALAGLTSLQQLDLRGTEVVNITPLACSTGLRKLNLMHTQVTDISPLAKLRQLEVITGE